MPAFPRSLRAKKGLLQCQKWSLQQASASFMRRSISYDQIRMFCRIGIVAGTEYP
jgi:hypothetical protein